MSGDRLLNASERWFRLLLRLYPIDFRDDMGDSVVETYRDRAREALARRGVIGIAGVWVHALVDTLRNGPGERARPAVSWRRSGNWARDLQFATRRLMRAPAMVAAVVGTLTVGLSWRCGRSSASRILRAHGPGGPNEQARHLTD